MKQKRSAVAQYSQFKYSQTCTRIYIHTQTYLHIYTYIHIYAHIGIFLSVIDTYKIYNKNSNTEKRTGQ